MDTVQEVRYFHVHRGADPSWKPGANFFFGRSTNRFVGFFDTSYQRVLDQGTGREHMVNDVLNNAVEVLSGRSPKDPAFASFYHYNPQLCLGEATKCLNHYLCLVREFVFEDVRRDSFSMLPSRYRCTWLIPKKPDCVQYWLQALDAGKAKIFELEVTGKIHVASQRYLHLGTYSLNTWRQHAFKYWAGIREVETKEDEVLFEGFVKVTRELTIQEAMAC